jgi:hypothetical protein
MIKIVFSFMTAFLFIAVANAQFVGSVKGIILDSETQLPLNNITISVENTEILQGTDFKGAFVITNIPSGNQIVQIFLEGYEAQLIPVLIETNSQIDLGTILLVFDLSISEENSGLISLTEDDLNANDGQSENTAGFLQASRDVFQNRAAFDFGQAFFRIRGYDSQSSQVLINGASMNKLFNGRPQWNNWGGLNDATRNQELNTGLIASNYNFGDVLGTINISTRASQYRPGIRISSSYSNRTYTGRGMVTYNSGLQKNGLAYSISASRRWGNQGFIDGTLYDAFGFFGALDYTLNSKNNLNLTAIYTPNRRASVSAITERVFDELGRKYNPYWGIQDGKKRSSRIRKVKEPIFMFSHFYESEKINLTTTIVYQIGKQGRSRLDYANAPNPNPNYWRYLPNITKKSQIDWNSLYDANTNTTNIADGGAARYLLYEDRTDDVLLTASSTLNAKITKHLSFDVGATYKSLFSENFASPVDLLGATYYADVNQFTLINSLPAKNDALGETNKGLNDRIKYNYDILSSQINGFAQLQFSYHKADFFLSGSYTTTNYQRDGKFLNESFADNSLGKSETVSFNDVGFKGGLTYKITGRHLVLLNGAYLSKAPTIRNSFVNSRENNNIVSDLESENISSAEASYIFRSPTIKTRVTGYFTDFKEGTDLNFIFAQSGSGTDFFQEVVTNIDKRHYGVELGFEYQAGPTVKTYLVAAYGKHTYSDNANVSINFDTAGFNDDLINEIGFKDLGETNIKDLRVANGPQQAYSVGVEYRDQKKWWIGATANYLSHAYVDVSTITRTSDFFINPDDPLGLPFDDIDVDLAKKLLEQEKFESYYLLNFIGGKSWRFKGKYLSLFISINNAFDQIFRTGGYEQSRTANYADLVEDTANGNDERSFGNKYWYGYGRTYFINLAYSF